MAIQVTGSNPRTVTLTYTAPNAQMDALLLDVARAVWQDVVDPVSGQPTLTFAQATTTQRLAQIDAYVKKHFLALARGVNTQAQMETARVAAEAENATKYGLT